MPNWRDTLHPDNGNMIDPDVLDPQRRFREWEEKQPPEYWERLRAQARIDVANWRGKEPTMRDLLGTTQ